MSHHRESATSVAQLKKSTLKRVLGVFDLFAIGYGDLGSSIFYALGVTALFALGATPIALSLAGLVFVCTALTYAEMTSICHDSGGSASFARYAFNDLISFIAGWGLLLDYVVTIAISAFAVGPYLTYFFAELQNTWDQIIFTVGLIGLLFIMNVVGVKSSTRISFILTFFTLLIQITVIVIGLVLLLNLREIIDHLRIGVANVDWSPTWGQFIKGTAMAMVAYTGIESIAQLGSESQKPINSTLRAFDLPICVLLVSYIGITLVALSAVSAQDLGTKYILNPIAAIVAQLPFGNVVLSPAVAILAAVVLAVAANAGLIGASRLTFNLGENYQLPQFFYRINSRFRTPVVALAFFSILSSAVVVASRGQLEFLADLYNFGAMLAFFSAHLSLIVSRIKKPDIRRPFRAPLNIPFGSFSLPLSAIVGALATFSVWCLVVITKPHGRYLGIGWMLFGICMYFIYRNKRRLKAVGSLSIEKISIPDFHFMKVKKILFFGGLGMETEMAQIACGLAKLYKAEMTALHILEITPSLPLDIEMPEWILAEEALKKMEAIGRESGIHVHFEIIRARSIVESILEVSEKGDYDLIIWGAFGSLENRGPKRMDHNVEKVLRKAPCRVLVY